MNARPIFKQAELYRQVTEWARQGFQVVLDVTTGEIRVSRKPDDDKPDPYSGVKLGK